MLSQISSYVSCIATKREQLSASKYPSAKNENIPRGRNDIMRSSEESHSHPFENEEFRQLCETKRKKRRIVIAKNDTLKAVSKKHDIRISGKRKNVVSLIELCSCKVYRCIVNCRLVLAVLSGLQTSN